MVADSPQDTPGEFDHIYRTEIRPLLFGNDGGSESRPTLVLLGGQPGSGTSRASARLTQELDGIIAVSGDDLRIFHADWNEEVRRRAELCLIDSLTCFVAGRSLRHLQPAVAAGHMA